MLIHKYHVRMSRTKSAQMKANFSKKSQMNGKQFLRRMANTEMLQIISGVLCCWLRAKNKTKQKQQNHKQNCDDEISI